MITSTGAYSCAQVEFLFERAASIKVDIETIMLWTLAVTVDDRDQIMMVILIR